MLDTDQDVTKYLNEVKQGAAASREEKAQLAAQIKQVQAEWDEEQKKFDKKMDELIKLRKESEKAERGPEGKLNTKKIQD